MISLLVLLQCLLVLTAPLIDQVRQQERPSRPPGIERPQAHELIADISARDVENLAQQPTVDPSDPTLLKIANRMRNTSRENMENYIEDSHPAASIASGHADVPAASIIHVRGRARRLTIHQIDPRLAQDWDFNQLFEIEVATDQGHELKAVVTSCPHSWKNARSLDEPITISGLLISSPPSAEVGGSDSTVSLMVAKNANWYPDRASTRMGTNAGMVELAAAGMDAALFDQPRKTNRKPIQSADADVLFQMMLATQQLASDRAGDRRADSGEFDPQEWLPAISDPLNNLGQRFLLQGRLTSVNRVAIDSRYYREKLGTDFYYQLNVMVPLGDNEIRIVDSNRDKQNPGDPDEMIYNRFNSFLVTVVVPELPDGILVGNRAGIQVWAEAYLFKLWSFQSLATREVSESMARPGPLFVATRIEPLDVNTSAAEQMSWIIGSVIAILIAMILAMVWWNVRSGRGRQRTVRKSPVKIDLPPEF